MFDEAIILVGGKGTRLRSLLAGTPKPMAPINQKPFLSFLLTFLKRANVNKVVLATGYGHDTILNYYGSDFHGMEIKYSNEKEPLGTGGGIKKALMRCEKPDVLVLNGDSFFEMDLSHFYRQFINSHSVIQLALKSMADVSRYGGVKIDSNRTVKAFNEKGLIGEGYINGGIYAINRAIIDLHLSEGPSSFEHDLLSKTEILTLSGIPYSGDFIDIGTPESYAKAQSLLGKEHLLEGSE